MCMYVYVYIKMDVKINNSEIDFSKMATLYFYCIIENVKRSCLNLQIQLSPFSAIISIKKSFVKEQTGAVVPPTSLSDRNQEFESLHSQKVELEKVVVHPCIPLVSSLNSLVALRILSLGPPLVDLIAL